MTDYLNKETIKVAIFLLFGLPFLIEIAIWLLNIVTNSSPENIETGTELLVQSQIPWWIGVIQWLTNIPGELDKFVILGFIALLIWLGEIKKH